MVEAIRVGGVGEIADGAVLVLPRAVTGTEEDIAVFRDGDAFYALDDMCTHQEALLSRGWVEDHEVVCPLHLARISELLGGEEITREILMEKAFTGGKNRYRDAWLQACGESLRILAKKLRAAVDSLAASDQDVAPGRRPARGCEGSAM